ncbi:CbiX/SirB N-terminal domain-containing protein [Metallosphaera hakonensis]|uniref:Sirohydrochlorin cobaltochelatase n=1 Tax=Metallosphaera hakonensis JCM 8857 = DSM 7519 TaxID=1293036 RepID=A0A2U9IU22_9CREN|nr:CbiX/SirB N-terminal domain-containing protein [Metallosphaera hakonensis]AWR99524.1 sirohydrochlorin cobaltochelatase [Metallosphaera hakonensis JCM 8857 = DSM 7519]
MKTGILLVLHGSRVNEWKEVAINYKDLLKEYFDLVEFGFIEFNEPSLRAATESLVKMGAQEIIAVPLLFAAGAHFYRDIPRLIGVNDNGEVDIEGKKVKVSIARPIGIDKRVAEILKERVEQVIESPRQI